MRVNHQRILLRLASALVLGFAIQPVSAQSTIVNIPSTDVVAAKKVYAEFDFITDYAWDRHNSFQGYTPRAVFGVGHHIEAGVNVAFAHVSGQDSPVEIQPNVKWRFYNNETNGVAASVGCMLYAPVANTAGTHTFVHCFTMTSKKFNGLHGPRFTGGAYALLNGPAQSTRFGGVVGYEQKITKRVGFVTDWTSGDNRLGYLNPGFNFVTSQNSSLTAGYSIANHGRGKNGLFVYYGALF